MTAPLNYLEAWQRHRAEREDEAKSRRSVLLPKLRAAGVTELVTTYDGCGDSGNVEDVRIEPETAAPATNAFDHEITDFVWVFAYALHTGFEINEGGYGELRWNVAEDLIDLDHSDRVTTTEDTFHEGL